MTATTIPAVPRRIGSAPGAGLRTVWLSTLIVVATLAAATVMVLAIVLAGGGIQPTHGDTTPRPQPTAGPGPDR